MKARIDFEDKVCLITGAGSKSGIGFSTAQIIGTLGAKVLLVATSERIYDRAKELEDLGVEAKGYIADLMDRRQVSNLINSIIDEYQRIDILINNAGMTQVGSEEIFSDFANLKDDEWDLTISRNLTTCYNVTHSVISHMINSNYGRIVNVSSVTGPVVSNPGESAYSAAKAAMIGMSRSIAIEVAKNNVMINNVLPGWIATGSQTESEAAASLNTPIGRGARPEEVGHMIVFLASEQASYITGQSFIVDGGNTIQEYKGPSALYY
ncbi:SDR family oxidoreductase [Anoxybacterium hadale]|uniref:SDR family oxidoreductase n=1 Tax=Anoxybacterium hadale TaxID=3408580 RepID=A0ACD1AFR6_9FIRM|nr:SDR family oxidoreductase [Clostridiales bacterium]